MALEHNGVKTPHSVKVPRLYKFCSKVLEEYFQFKGKIPKLILQIARKEPGSMLKLANKLLLALEAKLDVIKKAIENIGVLENNPGLRYELALVIAADMLLNEVESKRFERPCKPVLTMLEVRDQLLQEYEKCRQDTPAAENRCRPRWVCVNTLLTSTAQVKEHLTEAGFSLKQYTPRSYEQFLLSVRELAEHEFMEDFHFPAVLVFSPLGLRNSHLVATGKLLVQDKVSYLSPSVCGVTPGEVVLDACAAPGNKSTVLATMLNNDGKLICVERDEERYSVLRRRVKHHGVRCASFINEDFSSLAPEQYEGVTTVLLDPSCSNSGLALPTDEASVSDERYRRLSDMQFQLLSFALSIPSVRTVVYSTCSVDWMENENVIARALDRFGDIFELEDLSSKMEGWQNFGDENYSFAHKVLRTQPEFDLCHGFFVAKFVLRKENCLQEPNSEISNSICEAASETALVHTKEKKKKKKKSLLCSEEVDIGKDASSEAYVETASTVNGNSTVTGDECASNLDVVNETESAFNENVCESMKEKKKKKKRMECTEEVLNDEESVQPKPKKKKVVNDEAELVNGDELQPEKKKKKKNKGKENENDASILSNGAENLKLEMNEQKMEVNEVEELNDYENFESTKQRKKNPKDVSLDEENLKQKKKKKRKTEGTQSLDSNDFDVEKQKLLDGAEERLDDPDSIKQKKKKKKKSDKTSLM